MKHKIKYPVIILLSAVIFFLNGCKKEQSMPPPPMGEDYFPVVKGSWISYKVDSILWNDFFTPVKIDTFSFYIKMKMDTTFTDNQGNETMVWRKFYKNDTSGWILIRNYSLNKFPERVETFEENIRYIKMAFPVKHSITWNMNALNVYKATSSFYDDYDIPRTINSHNYDSCAVVIHKNLETLISKDYHEEIYAKHIGLVYKKITEVEKTVNGQWKKGYSYSYTIIDKGQD